MSTARRQVSIFINGREVANQIKSITAEKRKIVAELNRMTIGSDEYLAKMKELDQVNGVINNHRQAIRGTESSWSKLAAGAGKFLAVAGIAFSADLVIGYGKQLFATSVEMDTLGRKATTVLGPALGYVTTEAEKNAAAMGLTNSQYTDAVTNIADMLKPMGFTSDEAARQAVEMQNLAGALSEWSGGQFSATEVSGSFRKALVGEREELERYGISIKQGEINTRLAEAGMKDLTGQAKQQAEAMITLQLITEKSTDAQIAYAENADSAIRRQAELTAKITDISERMATLLLPVFERIVDGASMLTSGILSVVKSLESLSNPSRAAQQAFSAQSRSVAQLEEDLLPLLNRYDELTAKTNRSEEEQKELSELIQKIARITPQAVTQIDEYGKVLGINAGKSREFLEAEQQRLQFVNKEAIETVKKETAAIRENILALQKQIDLGGEFRQTREGGKVVPFSGEEIQATIDKVQELNRELKGAEKQLEFLETGTISEASTATKTKLSPTEDEIREQELRAKALAEQRKRQAEKEAADLQKRQEKLREIIEAFSEEKRLAELSEEDRKMEELRLKYQVQIDEAIALEKKKVEGATAARIELEKLQQQALDELRAELALESFEKEQARLDQLDQEANLRELERKEAKREADLAIAAELREYILSEQDQALADLEAHFQQLTMLAQQHGIDTLDIEIVYAKERQKILDDFAKKDQQKFIEAQQAKANVLAEVFGAMGVAISGALDLATAAGIENTGVGKLLAIAQIGISSAEAIAKATASAAGYAFPGNLIAMATAVGAVLSNIARAKSAIDGVTVPQKFMGGYTVRGATDGQLYNAKYIGEPQTGMLDYGGPVLFSSASGTPVLANERGREFLINNESLRNPVIANYARIIDNIQQGRVPQRADGGFTGEPATGTPAPAAGSEQAMMAVLAAVQQLNATLAAGIYAVVDDEQIVEIWKKQNQLNSIAGGTLGS